MRQSSLPLIQELLESVRKQDDLVHSWTRTLLAVQGGAAAAIGFLWTNSLSKAVSSLSTIGIAIIAIVGIWVCCKAAISDLKWQGRYIKYVKEIDSSKILFADIDPDLSGLGRQGKLFCFIKIVLSILWSVIILFSLISYLFVS